MHEHSMLSDVVFLMRIKSKHLLRNYIKPVTPDSGQIHPQNVLSLKPDSGQMDLHFASAIYCDRCAFSDLQLVITRNRKSMEA